jgi:hypothetical protein
LGKNLVLGHFSYLHSVHILLKKFGEKIFKTQNFTAVFVTIFRNVAKMLFLQFSNFQFFFQIQMPNQIFLIVFVYITMFVLTKSIIFGLNYQILQIFAKILPKN